MVCLELLFELFPLVIIAEAGCLFIRHSAESESQQVIVRITACTLVFVAQRGWLRTIPIQFETKTCQALLKTKYLSIQDRNDQIKSLTISLSKM